MRSAHLAAGIALFGTTTCGVVDAHECTLIGCSNQLNLLFRSSGNWPDGDYQLTLSANGSIQVCEMRLPQDLPSAGIGHPLACNPGNQLNTPFLSEELVCTETQARNSVSQNCSPNSGSVVLDAILDGNPESVRVELTLNGQSVVDQTFSPTYSNVSPNGPECGVVCRQASATFSLQ